MKSKTPAYLDPDETIVQRVDDLISHMTLEEKVGQMLHDAPAIERLGIPEYNWWNECLHGVARMRRNSIPDVATVFPQAIGMAASWDLTLFERVVIAISDEARAIYHEEQRIIAEGGRKKGSSLKGLTYWTPNINIFRDPRWGRGQETYGECPYLMSRFGVTFVKALQGDDPKYLKIVSTPKHFAVHSGPENERHRFNAVVSEKDLWETYLPAFEACVKEAGAHSVMGAYNRLNGEACCASPRLLEEILRKEWGFQGYVVSDCWAIKDIFMHHKLVGTREEASSIAVKAGCDLNCGECYPSLVEAHKQGFISEEEIDVAVRRLFTARFKLGMFDPPQRVKWAQIPYSVVDCEEHRELSREMARESIVLLKNENAFLPLGKDLKAIAVIGPNADDTLVLKGNYYGDTSYSVTPLAGIMKAVSTETRVLYAKGCSLMGDSIEGIRSAVEAAEEADVVIVVLGLSNAIEGEEGEGTDADRRDIDLPGVQEELLKAVHATGTPVVLALLSGSAVAINWADENVPAILAAWYPGEEGGNAIADVLFGEYNPAGRLPVTFYKSIEQIPAFEDYGMDGRTYRHFKGEPLYPFGYGLSYAQFEYGNLEIRPKTHPAGNPVSVKVDVQNVGDVPGGEVVQVYIRDEDASSRVPIWQLVGFERVYLEPGEVRTVELVVSPYWMAMVTDEGRRVVEPGWFEVSVGGVQPGWETKAKTTGVVTGRFEVVGKEKA